MALRSLSLLLSLALVLSASAMKHDPKVGGWKPIADTKGPKAVEIAKFAVNRYNMISNNLYKLIYVKIEKGEYQVVAGIKYRLIIKTTTTKKNDDNNNTKPHDSGEYEAIVWDKPSEHVRKLISFDRVKKSI